MPELPEVERARRIIEQAVVGKRIARVAVADDRIVYNGVLPRRFANTLRNRRVIAAHRRGKHLWLQLDESPFPLFHLGMTGAFETYDRPVGRPRFWKVELVTDDGTCLAMRNARRLGRIRLRHDPPNESPIRDLGYDPLLDTPSLTDIIDRVSARTAPIKAILLDQAFAAGVGNWIADEALFQARIAPQRRGDTLAPDEIRRLWKKLRAVVRKAVAVDADSARFPRTWLFHRRWRRRGHTDTVNGLPITFATVAGRSTAWVPAIQNPV